MSRIDTTFMTGLLLGGLAGAALAALYTPAPGRALTALRSRRSTRLQERHLDEQIEESFPASDPPSWTPVTSTNTY